MLRLEVKLLVAHFSVCYTCVHIRRICVFGTAFGREYGHSIHEFEFEYASNLESIQKFMR